MLAAEVEYQDLQSGQVGAGVLPGTDAPTQPENKANEAPNLSWLNSNLMRLISSGLRYPIEAQTKVAPCGSVGS